MQKINAIKYSRKKRLRLSTIKVDNLPDLVADWTIDAGTAVAAGKEMASEQVNAIITDRVSAYILDKAELLGVRLRVNVILTDANPPVPEQVHLSGNISPYAKTQLMQYISEQLGIPEEAQRWS